MPAPTNYWRGTTSGDATLGANWSNGSIPANGTTAVFDGNETTAIGDITVPLAAGSITLEFTADYSGGVDFSDILGAATLAAVTTSNSLLVTGGWAGETITVTAGVLGLGDNGLAGAVVLGAGCTFYFLGYEGDISLENYGGTVDTGDCDADISYFGRANNCTIDWGSTSVLTGAWDAGGFTHTYLGTGDLVLDTTSPFDMGLDAGGVNPADASGIDVEIDATGETITPSADISCGSFTLTAGIYGASAYDHTIHGNLIMEVGTLGNQTGRWTMAVDDGSLSVLYNREVNLVVADGVTPKLTGYTYLKSLTGSALAAINMQNQAMYIGRLGNKADKWAFLGSVTGTNRASYMVDTAGDAVTTPVDIDVPFRVLSSNLSCSFASVSVPTFLIEGTSNGEKSTVSVANLEAATVQIGSEASPTRAGGLVLTGVAKIGSLAKGADNTGANTLHLASAYVECSGVFDGADITITNDDDTVHLHGLSSGTLQNATFEAGKTVHAHDFLTYGSGGTANANVTEDSETNPGNLPLVGAA